MMNDTRGDGPVWLVDSVNLAIIPVIDGLCEAIRVTMIGRALGACNPEGRGRGKSQPGNRAEEEKVRKAMQGIE